MIIALVTFVLACAIAYFFISQKNAKEVKAKAEAAQLKRTEDRAEKKKEEKKKEEEIASKRAWLDKLYAKLGKDKKLLGPDELNKGILEAIAAGKDPNASTTMGNDAGDTVLMHSAHWGYLTACEKLIKAGANVNATDGNGKTALYRTVELWNSSRHITTISPDAPAIVKLLIANKADVDIQVTNKFEWARAKGDKKRCYEGWGEDDTALIEAVKCERGYPEEENKDKMIELIQLLIDAGADTNLQGFRGNTAHYHASERVKAILPTKAIKKKKKKKSKGKSSTQEE